MKTKKYLMISALALLACSCQDEEQGSVHPTPGQDVQFGATLEQSSSRTIYGDSHTNTDGRFFPIYWENGDEVIVCSPECADAGGVGNANYKVNVGDNTTQNYATSLDKTGDIGVRWGNNATGNFYSFYPASHAELGGDNKTMTITMPAQQDNNIEKNQDGTIKIVRPDMEACFMYAKTTASAGETVNLQYIPLSTAVRFTLNGPSHAGADSVTVTYVRLYAPEGTIIDGAFTLNFEPTDSNSPTLTPITNKTRNYVTMNVADPNTNRYLTLGYNQSAELCAFLLISKEMDITDQWYIEIGTSSGKSYKKYLDAHSDENRTLVPGQVHYLPGLPNLDVDSAWDPANWMANLQRNVYLSEISLPGSWNSGNIDSQPTFGTYPNVVNGTDIDKQYKAGVRAFHIDTRWNAERSGIPGFYRYTPTDLGVATGGASYDAGDGRYMDSENDSFEDVLLHRIIYEDPSNPENNRPRDDEYMVVICTFAQDSYNVTDFNGNLDWKGRISQICASSDKVVDARTLTPNTCVADVLGKVIVVVNTYSTDAVTDSKCLFMNMGMELVEDEFTGQDYYTTDLKWNNITSSGLSMYATHAQITKDQEETPSDRGFAPTLSQRETHLQNILNVSKNNYNNLANYQHNIWYYMGLGGYYYSTTGWLDRVVEDHEGIARDLNGWINGKVTEMSNGGDYYPLGIVLMNCAIQYEDVVQNILQMNNKYRKAYDPTRSPVDGTDIEGNMGGTSNNAVQSAAPGYSSGMTDNNTNAIGWSRCR